MQLNEFKNISTHKTIKYLDKICHKDYKQAIGVLNSKIEDGRAIRDKLLSLQAPYNKSKGEYRPYGLKASQ